MRVGAHYAFTSSVIGFIFAASQFLIYISNPHGTHKHVNVPGGAYTSFIIMVFLSVVIFIIQLIGGPFIFTKEVICRKCQSRQKLDRIPFFAGKGYRQPSCSCGGKWEPASFWELKP